MFYTNNYFRQHNDNHEIDDYKEFYKKFSNTREFGGKFTHHDHLVKNRFLNVYGHMINIFLRKKPSNVIDIGCGSGINLPLSRFFPQTNFVGIDYAEKALEHSREVYPHVDFHIKDAFNLDYDRKFDVAIISGVLILYKEELDRVKLLENAKESIKDDGVVVAIVWKDSWLLKYSIYLSRLIAKIRRIELPNDFMGVHFTEQDASRMVKKAGMVVDETIHLSAEYGALEAVRYLNMKKYNRDFASGERQLSEKPLNILQDLQGESGSRYLMRLFYWVSTIVPSSLNMYSIYLLKKK